MITSAEITDFKRDGAVVLRGIFSGWLDVMAAGVEANMQHPSQYASENAVAAGEGRFFDDYCNWQRIKPLQQMVEQSPAAQLAALAMQSQTAQFFHDHVLVKEPHTTKPTPWHQDAPYYFVQGKQTVSMWLPLEPVDAASLRFVRGSHRWPKLVRPVSWADDSDFYSNDTDFMPLPPSLLSLDNKPSSSAHKTDIKAHQRAVAAAIRAQKNTESAKITVTNDDILQWTLQPGDAVLFNFRTVHGAHGNASTARRRALSLRWVGDDAHYVQQRAGRTSPPYPGHNMRAGQRLREDWFPVIWPPQRQG